MSEHDMQLSIMAEAALRANQDDRWALLYAIPNGQYRPGQRMEAGLKSGVPDLCLPVPRAALADRPAYHALYIELKKPGEKPRKEQVKWLDALNRQGNHAVWTDDADLAVALIKWYLGTAQ
jgi:hypothetical protein